MTRNRSYGIFALFAVCLSLTGCGGLGDIMVNPYIALRSVSGHLEVTVCRNIATREVFLQEREKGGTWTDVWAGTALLSLAAGQTFTSTELPTKIVLAEPRMLGGDELDIILNSAEAGDLGINAEVQVPDDGMPTDEWLLADGTLSNKPCSLAERLGQP